MDEATANQRHRRCLSSAKPNPSTVTTATTAGIADLLKDCSEAEGAALECDPEVWAMFSQSFRQVQAVLDRNRALIQQVNENHQSKSADNMVKNVALIQEINQNVSKVASLYSDRISPPHFTSERRTVTTLRPTKAVPNREPSLSIGWKFFCRNEGPVPLGLQIRTVID